MASTPNDQGDGHMPGPPGQILVDSPTAARMIAVSLRTLWTLSSKGEIPRVLIGRAVRYRVVDLERYCERLATVPSPLDQASN